MIRGTIAIPCTGPTSRRTPSTCCSRRLLKVANYEDLSPEDECARIANSTGFDERIPEDGAIRAIEHHLMRVWRSAQRPVNPCCPTNTCIACCAPVPWTTLTKPTQNTLPLVAAEANLHYTSQDGGLDAGNIFGRYSEGHLHADVVLSDHYMTHLMVSYRSWTTPRSSSVGWGHCGDSICVVPSSRSERERCRLSWWSNHWMPRFVRCYHAPPNEKSRGNSASTRQNSTSTAMQPSFSPPFRLVLDL